MSQSYGDPAYQYATGSPYYSYVSDGVSAVVSIDVNYGAGYIFALVVNGITSGTSSDGYTLSQCPYGSTQVGSLGATITFTGTQSIVAISVYSQ